MLRQWDDLASAKSYLTGGIGSRHYGEAIGNAYELPPDRAYCETGPVVPGRRFGGGYRLLVSLGGVPERWWLAGSLPNLPGW
jgi:hypothetical protein